MSKRLIDTIGQAFILAYQEDTEQLTSFLGNIGCPVEVLRQLHRSEYQTYSRSYLCLLSHRKAWERALLLDQPTLIMEADFVPVANFAALPAPFDPMDNTLGIAWLYTCAPQIYHITEQGYAEGYSTAMVAYVVTKHSAWRLIELAASVYLDPGPATYTPWDSGIEYYLRDRNFRNYVPWRNYGEHGGIPNPEHRQNNLTTTHRADVLYGPLAFEPLYGNVLRERMYGRFKGLGRLLLNKYLRGPVIRNSANPARLLAFALGRQLTLRL